MKRITMMSLAAALLVVFAGLALADDDASKGAGTKTNTVAPHNTHVGAADKDHRGDVDKPHSGTSTPRIDRREGRQEKRVEQGVRSGQLTRHEARHLRHGERHIRRMERRAKADGKVTPGERERITAAQNRESRKIYRDKHNNRTR